MLGRLSRRYIQYCGGCVASASTPRPRTPEPKTGVGVGVGAGTGAGADCRARTGHQPACHCCRGICTPWPQARRCLFAIHLPPAGQLSPPAHLQIFSLCLRLPPTRTHTAPSSVAAGAVMSTADPGSHAAETGRPRKRAAEACTFCRRRKVRLFLYVCRAVERDTEVGRSSAVPRSLRVRVARRMERRAIMSP